MSVKGAAPGNKEQKTKAMWQDALRFPALHCLEFIVKLFFCHPESRAARGRHDFGVHGTPYVELNAVKDLELVENTRFTAMLRMTKH
jgi:hypothetical protein